MEAGVGTLVHLDTAKKPRGERQRPLGNEARIVLFTGVRYDRATAEKGGRDPNGAQPGRKRI